MSVKPIPEGFHTVTPVLAVEGGVEALDFYERAFGAQERSRVPVPGDRIMSLELAIGDSTVMLADEFPEMGVVSPLSVGGTATVLQISTDDVDALWERAVAAGAEVVHPPADGFWGERHGQLLDPYGHKWGLAQHVRDVPDEEVVAAAAALFS
jgi:PhnB protein